MREKHETADPCGERAPAQVELSQLLPPCRVREGALNEGRGKGLTWEGTLHEGVGRGASNEGRRGVK